MDNAKSRGRPTGAYFGVPGFTHSVKPWLEAKEALAALGMG